MNFCMANTQSEEEREEKERKKKQFRVKPRRTTIHATHRVRGRRDELNDSAESWLNCRSQLHASLEDNRVIDMCSFFFVFLMQKQKMVLGLNNINK